MPVTSSLVASLRPALLNLGWVSEPSGSFMKIFSSSFSPFIVSRYFFFCVCVDLTQHPLNWNQWVFIWNPRCFWGTSGLRTALFRSELLHVSSLVGGCMCAFWMEKPEERGWERMSVSVFQPPALKQKTFHVGQGRRYSPSRWVITPPGGTLGKDAQGHSHWPPGICLHYLLARPGVTRCQVIPKGPGAGILFLISHHPGWIWWRQADWNEPASW